MAAAGETATLLSLETEDVSFVSFYSACFKPTGSDK
jgi:hypothetical protein